MGLTDVILTITNPETGQSEKASFLVDSGASFTALPYRMQKKLKIKPTTKKQFSLADGSHIKRNIGNVYIDYQGEKVASPVILGEKGDSALLGALTLESLGLVLDPLKRELRQATLRM